MHESGRGANNENCKPQHNIDTVMVNITSLQTNPVDEMYHQAIAVAP